MNVQQHSDPEEAINAVVQEILRTQWRQEPVVRIDSPPGAGKTDIVEKLAVQSMALLHERVMIATNTNEQALDLARRLATHYPGQPCHIFLRAGVTPPAAFHQIKNLTIATKSDQLPAGPCIIIATASKWTWLSMELEPFALLIVDEAFQLPDFRFHPIAGMASRIVLIGDPGQIDPFVTSSIDRWKGLSTGPQVSCPEALLVRHPEVLRFSLPVSRRLVADTVRFVQPAFYPGLPFTALRTSPPTPPGCPYALQSGEGKPNLVRRGEVHTRIESGQSLLMRELPAKHTGENDPELAQSIADTIDALIESGLATPAQIGVVCAHVPQVNAVQERLSARSQHVFVETANRFQGLERDFILVHHPLSGRADVDQFHADTGRLCVMLSRHRVACIVFGRAGIEEKLKSAPMRGERILGQPNDGEFEGRRAHLTLLRMLRREQRIFTHPT